MFCVRSFWHVIRFARGVRMLLMLYNQMQVSYLHGPRGMHTFGLLKLWGLSAQCGLFAGNSHLHLMRLPVGYLVEKMTVVLPALLC